MRSDPINIAQKLKSERTRLGKNMEIIGEESGILRRSIYDIENYRIDRLKVANIRKLFGALGEVPHEIIPPEMPDSIDNSEAERRHLSLCKLIRGRRKQLGLSLENLAEMTGKEFANLSKIEKGRGGGREATMTLLGATLQTFIEALGLPDEYFDTSYLSMFGHDPGGWVCNHCGSLYTRYRVRCDCPDYMSPKERSAYLKSRSRGTSEE